MFGFVSAGDPELGQGKERSMGGLRSGRSRVPKPPASGGNVVKQYPRVSGVEDDRRDLREDPKNVPDRSTTPEQANEALAAPALPPEDAPSGQEQSSFDEGMDANLPTLASPDVERSFGWDSMGNVGRDKSEQGESKSEISWFPEPAEVSGPVAASDSKLDEEGRVTKEDSMHPAGFDSFGNSEALAVFDSKAAHSSKSAADSSLPAAVRGRGHSRRQSAEATAEQIGVAPPRSAHRKSGLDIENSVVHSTRSSAVAKPIERQDESVQPIESKQRSASLTVSPQGVAATYGPVPENAAADSLFPVHKLGKARQETAISNLRQQAPSLAPPTAPENDPIGIEDRDVTVNTGRRSRTTYPSNGSDRIYSVAYRMKMSMPATPTGKRLEHCRSAFESLFRKMDEEPDFATGIRQMIPDIDSIRVTRRTPTNWAWVWNHCATEPGVMELVPFVQHWSPNPLWSVFHPLLNGKNVGGFKRWGHLY